MRGQLPEYAALGGRHRLARDMLCGPGYVRPTSSSLQGVQERQGAPALPHSEDLHLPALTEEIMPHVRAAMDLDHPLADLAVLATPVLRAAVQYVAGFAGNGAAEAMEAIAHGDAKSSKVVGRKINEIKLPSGVTIGAIVRGDDVLIAHDDVIVVSDDHVILFMVDKSQIRAVERLFQVGLTFF